MDELPEVLPPRPCILEDIIIFRPPLRHEHLQLASEILRVAERALVDANWVIVTSSL